MSDKNTNTCENCDCDIDHNSWCCEKCFELFDGDRFLSQEDVDQEKEYWAMKSSIESLTADLAAMTADRDRLREVVEKLPKYEDTGKHFSTDKFAWVWVCESDIENGGHKEQKLEWMAVHYHNRMWSPFGYAAYCENSFLWDGKFYSTRQAAIAARTDKGGEG